MKISKFLLFFGLSYCISCNNIDLIKPPSPQKIFSSYHSSVVLIKNEFLYKIQFDNSDKVYFFSLQGDTIPMFYADYDSAYPYRSIEFGSGFFIDRYGVIATNKHVIEGPMGLSSVREIAKKRLENIRESLLEKIQPLDDTVRLCEYLLSRSANSDNLELSNYLTTVRLKRGAFQALLDELENDRGNEIKLSVVNCRIGIACDTDFNRTGHLIECTKLKVSDDDKIDLALIQTVFRQLPVGVIHIPLTRNQDNEFSTYPDSIVNKQLEINTKLFMIGYNKGGYIGLTSNGLRPQLTQGEVSQQSDETQVLYSIPSLPGSSGSPIFDEWGNIVAINHSGIYPSQSFNYGILVKHLHDLYNK